MPELPEIEHLRRSLEPTLPGRRVTGVAVRRRDVVHVPGHACSLRAALLGGGKIRHLARHGKQLAIVVHDGRALCVHLGMSGQLIHSPRPPTAAHVHLRWRLDDGSYLSFRDPRRFGGVWAFEAEAELREQRWRGLGPDALSLTGATLNAAIRGRQRAIKAALLDQAIVAGVGNIYADEALFTAGIRPDRSCTSLSQHEVNVLARAIRRVLAAAIDGGGSSIRDYVNGAGEPGWFQVHHAVYGRGGQECVRCGRQLASLTLAQRTTVMCPACQR